MYLNHQQCQQTNASSAIRRFFKKISWLIIAAFSILFFKIQVFAQDTTPPNVMIAGVNANTNSATIDFSITFTEVVSGFIQSDLVITNGIINSLSVGITTYTYNSTLGTTDIAGNTNALLDGPTGMVVDSNGNILVADRNNHRVQVFSSAGVYQSTIGTGAAVTDNTGFDSPWDVAIDAQGNIYVSDQNNHRIQVYNSSLVYQATIGTGSEVADNTGFDSPASIDIDASGNLYVADRDNHRIQIYDHTLTYVATIGTGSMVVDNTGFNSPRDVAVDGSGNVYVADRTNNRVQVFGPAPTYTYTNSISGLTFPLGVAVEGDGTLYVVEQASHRLDIYDNTQTLMATVASGLGSDNDDLTFPSGVTLGNSGEILIADSSNERVQIFNSSQTYTASVTASTEGDVVLNIPAMIATDGAGNQNTVGEGIINYDATAPQPIISSGVGSATNMSPFDVLIDFSETVNNFNTLDLTIGNGTLSNFQFPSSAYTFDRDIGSLTGLGSIDDVLVGSNGNVYIADGGNSLVHVFDNSGASISTFTGGSLDSPTGLAIGPNANIYVIDDSNTEAYVYTASGSLVNSFGSSDFSGNPLAIAVANSGNIYVLEDDPLVHVYNSSLTLLASFGGNTLNNPRDILVDQTGSIHVLDDGDNAIYVFDPNNNLTSTIAINPAPPASGYEDFVLNSDGSYLITDTSPLVSVYDGSNLTTTFGSGNFATGQVSGASIDNMGNIYVGDRSADIIKVFVTPRTGYLATITPATEGLVTVDIASSAASDLAGNSSLAASQFSSTFDQTAPTVTLSTSEGSPTTATSFTVTAQFSEDMLGFTIDDFTLINATASNFVVVDASTYTIDLTPTMDGNVTIDLATGIATDLAGNDNTAATQFLIVSDRFIPTVEILSTVGSATNSSPMPLLVNFSEAISGFDIADLTVTNGMAANLTRMASQYLFKDRIGTGFSDVTNNALNRPRSIAIDVLDNVYVADRSNHRVQIFDTNHNYVATIGTTGQAQTDNSGFNSPNGIAVDALGNIYVSDQGNHRVQVFDPNRTYLATIGTSGQQQTDNTGFNEPADLGIDASGNIYVVDDVNHRVQVFDASRNYIATMGISNNPGQDNSRFNRPKNIAFDNLGNIYVVDQSNQRVQVFDSSRIYIATIGITGQFQTDNTGFNNPSGIFIDHNGNIYVADSQNNRVQVYDSNRDYISTIGTTGMIQTDNSGFGSGSPQDIVTNSLGDVYVLDENNSRVQIFQRPMESYTVDITPTVDGDVVTMIGADMVTDTGTNGNTSSNSLTVNYDTSGPTATFQGVDPINTDTPFSITFHFNEPTFNFQISDIRTSFTSGLNATIANLTEVSNTVYRLDITPDGSTQDIHILVFNNSIEDALGNMNQVIEVTIPYDIAGPVMDVQNEPSRVNNLSPFNITMQFNEVVTGFALEDLSITNATISDFTMVDADTYTANLTPSGGGNISISLLDASVTDALQNTNFSSLPVTILFDSSPPQATITTGQNPTNLSTFDIQIQFNEPVSGFDQGDLLLTNASLNTFTSPTGQYGYLATVGSGVIGGSNDQFSFPEDVIVAPSGNIYVADASNNRVQVFDANRNYLTTIGTGTNGNGNDQFNYPRGLAIDNQGRIFIADENNNRVQVFDANHNYIATIGTGVFGIGNDQFGQPQDVDIDSNGNIYVADTGNSRVQVFNSSFTYLATLSNTADGVVVGPSGIIYVVTRFFANIVGKVEAFDSNFNRLFTLGSASLPGGEDNFNRPEKLAISSQGDLYVGDTRNNHVLVFDALGNYLMTIGNGSGNANDQFSRPAGLSFDSNGNLYVSDRGNNRIQVLSAPEERYAANLTANGEGTITVTVPNGSLTDQAGNPSVSDRNLNIVVDQTAPTVVLTSSAGSIASAPFTVTAQFSEAVTGVSLADFQVGNGASSSFTVVDQDTYTFTVSPSAEGNVTVDLPGTIAHDLSGNSNDAASQFVIPFSQASPSVVLSTMEISPTTNQSFDVNITFSEDVVGFDQSDITVGNGSVTGLTQSGLVYQVTIQATADGTVTVEVPAGVATDVAAVSNTTSNQLNVHVDINPPGVSIISTSGSVVNAAFATTLQFTETVTGFDVMDITAGNATLSNFTTVDGDTYTIEVTPTTAGQVTLDVGAAVAQDAVGNGNTPSAQFSRTFNQSAVSTTISTTESSPSNSTSFPISLNFGTRTNATNLGFTLSNATLDGYVDQTISYDYGLTINPSNITTPFGVAVNLDGLIFVSGNNRIVIYDASGTLVGGIGLGTVGNGNGQFNDVRDISLDASGNVYAVDRVNHRIQIFSAGSFSFQQEFGSRGSGDMQFEFPSGIAIAPNGNVFVADENNERIQVFDSNLNYVLTMGTTLTQGSTNALFRRPEDVFVDGNGRIYIADTGNDRIQIYNSDFSYFGTIGTGSAGSGNDTFNNPSGVFVDGFGDIYVADLTNHRVQVFGSDLVYKRTLGTGAAGSGNDVFDNPIALTLNSLGTEIYIVDQSNNRIQVFDVDVSDITANVIPTIEGVVQVSMSASVAMDAFGNPNAGSDILEITHDLTGPTVDIQDEPVVTNNTPFTVTFEFSEGVNGFDVNDITLGNASISTFTTIDANTYTALITPNGVGDITVDIAANVVTDLAGNNNLAAPQAMITYDITPPDVVISSLVGTATNTFFFATFTFTETITGFDLGDIIASNAGLSNLTGAGTTYTATVTPTVEGQVTLNVNAGVASDAAGNGNTAASQFTLTYDVTPPTVTLLHNIPTISSATAESVTATFSETVLGFAIEDISVTNGTVPFFSGNLLQIAPASEGTVTFQIHEGSVTDAAGNGNVVSNLVTFVSDQTGPSVNFINVPEAVNASNSFMLTLVFSEDAGPVTTNHFQVINGSPTSVTGSGNTYALEVTPDGMGDISVTSLTGLTDAAGNHVINMAQETITLDTTPPNVTITSAASIAINLSPLRVTITFTEDIEGFELADLAIVNGTASNLTGSGSVYTADITPIAQGNMTVDIAAGAVTDMVTNENIAATQFAVIYDTTEPTVTISSAVTDPTNTNPIVINIDFDEAVTGLDLSDITVTNGSVSNLNGLGANYTVDITPVMEGPVTALIAEQAVTDMAGNGNVSSNTYSVNSDRTAPTVSITTSEISPTNSGAFLTQFSFSENVIGFDGTDVTVINGTLSNFTGTGDSYSATITATTNDRTVTVDILGGAAFDDAGNGNMVSNTLSVVVDMAGPIPTINAPIGTAGSTFAVTFTFNETVADFTASDIVLVNATLSNFAGAGTSYTADLTPSGTNTITIDVPANAATDVLGNMSVAATQVSIVSDLTAPSVVISTIEASPTNDSPISVSMVFSEDVTGLMLSDLAVVNGTVSNLVGTGTTFTADIAPLVDGTVTVDIAANSVTDIAGNGNTAATQFSITSDRTSPTVGITTTAVNPSNVSSVPIMITFSEVVTGFDITDLTVANGTASNFAGSGTSYTTDIIPMGDGSITVDIVANSVTDIAGNGNATAAQFSLVSDTTSPTITIGSMASSPSNASVFTATFIFSESVSGFAVDDVMVGNGTISNFLGSGSTYTADISPVADGVVTIDVLAGIAMDAAENGNIAASQLIITSDRTAPTILSINRMDVSPTHETSVTYAISFSEDVVNLDVGDFVLTNSTISADISAVSSSSGASFIVTVSGIIGSGTLRLDIADASGIQDTAGNSVSNTLEGEAYTRTDAPTDITLSSSSIAENNTIGDLVGSLNAVDPNASDQHIYTLVTGAGDDDNSSFSIDNTNGLRAETVFDFELKTSYLIRVQTDDGLGGTFQKALMISIINVAEPIIRVDGTLNFGPTAINLSSQMTFEIHNDGDGDLLVSDVTYPTGFIDNFSSGTVPAFGSMTIQVTFTPTEVRAYSGQVMVTSDAGNANLSISGVGDRITSVDDGQIDLRQIKLYPNPSDKQLWIEIGGLNQYKPTLEIYNISGTRLWRLEEVEEHRVQIDVSTYEQGIYLIHIVTSQGTVEKKVMIKR